MAIDPSIVLGLQPVPAIDPTAAAAKVAQYRNLISETAYRDQQRQTNIATEQRTQQQNVEAQRQLAGDQLEGQLTAANTVTSPDGSVQTNHDAVRQALAQAGYGDRAATYLTRVQIPAEKELLSIQTTKLDNGKKQLDALGSTLQSLSQTPDEQLPQAYDENVQRLTQQGMLKPGEVPPSQAILQQGGVPALRQFVNQHAQAAMTAGQQIQEHQKALDYAQTLVKFKEDVAEKAPDTAEKWTNTLAQLFGASGGGPDQWAAAQKTALQMGAPVNAVNQFGDFSPESVARANDLGKTPEQRQTAAAAAATLAETATRDAETARHNLADEAAKNTENALAAKKFTAEFGGDAVKGWAATIKDNPDAASSIPPNLRSAVQQQFSQETGLPFPKPLSGQTKMQETAARNGLGALQQVSEDIQDPEVQSRLGPLLGRLGNVEQDVGATVGMSPEAAAKAQRLRTNMRMMALQEGRSVFGARIPQQMMESFQSASPNVKMDPGVMTGALQGMQDAATRTLDAADQERFGGKMRTREDRGIKPMDFAAGTKRVASKADYDALPKGAQYIDTDGKTYTKK